MTALERRRCSASLDPLSPAQGRCQYLILCVHALIVWRAPVRPMHDRLVSQGKAGYVRVLRKPAPLGREHLFAALRTYFENQW